MTPAERVRFALETAGSRRNGHDWQCPAHQDQKASLSVREGGDGKAVLHCHAECPTQAVLAALGLDWSDLFPEDRKGKAEIVATYDYTDEQGGLLYQAVRYFPKAFKRRRPDGNGGWTWKLGDIRLVLYRLPRVLAAIEAGAPVYVVEGEKDVHAIEQAGATATTIIGGVNGRWLPEFSKLLAKTRVLVVADDDPPGRRRAAATARAIAGLGSQVEMVKPAVGKDAADHLAAGFGLDDFTPLAPGDAPAAERPPAEPVPLDQGGELLDQVEAFVRRFVVFATDIQAVAVALWVMHTWCFEAAETTPYLHVNSPEKQSGKSRLLEVLAQLARGALQAANMTAAALYRSISDPAPAVLFDEVQELFGRGADDDQRQLRACLNSGYRLGGAAMRCVGEGAKQTVAEFPTFCPKVLAGTGSLPDMLADRAIPIRLQRKTRDEPVERFRIRRIRGEAEALRRRLAGWAQVAVPVLRDADPELPDQLDDRAQDCWEPLLALAELAGGDWPKRARAAAVELAGADRQADPSVGTLLLAHCWEAFAGEDTDRLATNRLLELLCARDDGPWAEWWAKHLHDDGQAKVAAARLARLLRPFGIAPKVLDFEGRKARGYALSAFGDAFGRYLPSLDPHPVPLPRNLPAQASFRDVTETPPVTSAQAADQPRYGVTSSSAATGAIPASGSPGDHQGRSL